MITMKHYKLILATIISLILPLLSWGDTSAEIAKNESMTEELKEFYSKHSQTYTDEEIKAKKEDNFFLRYQEEPNSVVLNAYKKSDFTKMNKIKKLLAKKGDAKAKANLVEMYAYGDGIIQDYKEAFKWFSLSAGKNNAKAVLKLGIFYLEGHGVVQDYIKPHMWLNIASSNENRNVKKDRNLLASKLMTPSQIEKAQKLVRKCVAKKYMKYCDNKLYVR